jgi:hypothetical protein
VLSLRREGPFYADVYIAERWQVATRERLGPLGGGLSVAQRTTLRPSQGEVWLARLQVYLDPARPERAGDSLFVALPSAQMTRGEVLRALLKEAEARRLRPDTAAALLERDWPATASYDELQKQIAFWLGQLPDDLTAPVLLSDPALQRAPPPPPAGVSTPATPSTPWRGASPLGGAFGAPAGLLVSVVERA